MRFIEIQGELIKGKCVKRAEWTDGTIVCREIPEAMKETLKQNPANKRYFETKPFPFPVMHLTRFLKISNNRISNYMTNPKDMFAKDWEVITLENEKEEK